MGTRRQFLKASLSGSAAIGLAGAVPQWFLRASAAAEQKPGDTILVVVQLSGGNDGLNTVIPYGDDAYYQNRFTLAVPRNQVLKINDQIGFHPSLREFARMFEDGDLAVVQGVGYPNPNRSHFESMDLWHTAHQMPETDRTGWLGRAVDQGISAGDLPAIHMGNGVQPLALASSSRPAPSMQSIEDFELRILRNRAIRPVVEPRILNKSSDPHTLLGYVHENASVALATGHQLERIQRSDRQRFGYPGSNLGRNLGNVAQLIGSGLPTRIYYTTCDGFDTHANQAQAHQGLLSDVGASLGAFMKEMRDQGNRERVAVLVFSEFGRRVRENASGGTDHGSAAPVFVLGSNLAQNVVGDHPSLEDLDQGDLKYALDYRRVYAELLDRHLTVDSRPIVGDRFEPAGIFSASS